MEDTYSDIAGRMMHYSLCITTFNRYDLLIKSFQKVLNDDRITEIVISDDHSHVDVYNKIVEFCNHEMKVRVYRNTENVGMSMNKKLAIERAKNDTCILFDSDNEIDSSYLDSLDNIELKQDTIYCPEFARPNFNYTEFTGLMISKQNAKDFKDNSMFGCMMNTCNYVVNRMRYLLTYQYDRRVKASDTIHFNHLHLKGGGKFYVVEGMQYNHLVHDESGFMEDAVYNLKKASDTMRKIEAL